MLNLVKEYAFPILLEHGIEGYTIELSNKKRSLGTCYPISKRIEISRHYLKAEGGLTGNVKDTIRHEIAHAMAWDRFQSMGHGVRWKQCAKILGANPVARSKVIAIPHNWELRFGKEVIGKFYRKPTKDYSACYIVGQREETQGRLTLHKVK